MNVQNVKNISQFEDKSLLIVDDDNPFRERLARAMEKKGKIEMYDCICLEPHTP